MGEAYVVLTIAATVGVWLASSFASTVLGFIPSSIGGTGGAAAGTAPNTWVALLVNGAIVAGVVVLAGHLHGKLGSEIKRAA